MNICFNVDKQKLTRIDDEFLVDKSQDYLYVKIHFSSEWDNLAKRILFRQKSRSYLIELQETEEEGFYSCVVPHEVLGNYFTITAVGVLEEVRITTNFIGILLEKSLYTNKITPTTDPSEDIFTKIWKELDTNSYIYINDIKDYLYEIYYDKLDYDYAEDYFQKKNIPVGACSSVRKGKYYGRNFDWLYGEETEFIIQTSKKGTRNSSMGIGFCEGLTNDLVKNRENSRLYKILPFLVSDGINEKGLIINTNVVPQDHGITIKTTPLVEEKHCINLSMLVRFCLDWFDTATECVEYIRDYVSLYIPNTLAEMGYEQHFMIADSKNTYSLEIIENEVVIKEISEKPYMTNFYLENVVFNDDGSVYSPATQDEEHNAIITNHITENGCGLERFNIINENYESINSKQDMRELLTDLNYTKSYDINNGWYTEFTGIHHLTVTNDPEDFTDVIDKAYEKYSQRSRDKESEYYGTWQTNHSCVYDLAEKKLYLVVQEDGEEIEYNFEIGYIEKVSWNDIQDKPNGLVVDRNYVHTDNNYSNSEKNKLDNKQDKLTAGDNITITGNVISAVVSKSTVEGETLIVPGSYVENEELIL